MPIDFLFKKKKFLTCTTSKWRFGDEGGGEGEKLSAYKNKN